jgi:hypothetical protein
MRNAILSFLALISLTVHLAIADDPPKTEEDIRREIAIAEFTKKMKAANYPALFEAAAAEFRVPPDVLKGVSFAETRWDHLMWPPGEIRSPETGMPRPFGIMSLWDNEFFGHSLIEAAQLLGKDPEELKKDPFQNMRGGAALLRKLYDETPRPEGTTETDVESWRYAIRKYCGIPEPDLNAQHALDVYTFMSQGYHQYGLEWNARPVNLEPIREETRRIVAEERPKREARLAANPDLQDNSIAEPPKPLAAKTAKPAQKAPAPVAVTTLEPPSQAERSSRAQWWVTLLGAAILVGGIIFFLIQSKKQPKPPK